MTIDNKGKQSNFLNKLKHFPDLGELHLSIIFFSLSASGTHCGTEVNVKCAVHTFV